MTWLYILEEKGLLKQPWAQCNLLEKLSYLIFHLHSWKQITLALKSDSCSAQIRFFHGKWGELNKSNLLLSLVPLTSPLLWEWTQPFPGQQTHLMLSAWPPPEQRDYFGKLERCNESSILAEKVLMTKCPGNLCFAKSHIWLWKRVKIHNNLFWLPLPKKKRL